MFEALAERLNSTFRNLSGRGRIGEHNIRDAMGDVRSALLEADVHLDVVESFCADVVQDAEGREVTKSLKPGQELISIVHQRLIDLMGPEDPELMLVEPGPTIVMLCGLQGSGKTTTCGKLSAHLAALGKDVMVAAADLQRPAAIEQLRTVTHTVAEQASGNRRVLFYAEPDKCAAYGEAVGVTVSVCRNAAQRAREEGVDVLLIDTAGRLHIDTPLMQELEAIDRALQPHQILLIVDAMIGQDAVNSARAFNERLAIDGVILTKFDSDTRGGAALSVKQVTGAPIKFIGTGEHHDALEPFHPERMAGRILGMGDVVSLVEKAQKEVSEEEAEKLAEKMARGQLTLVDFVSQLRAIRRMGPMKKVLGMLPGVGSALKDIDIDDGQIDRVEGIVNSMTPAERQDASLLNRSRIKRVSRGSGTSTAEVGRLTKQFEAMRKMGKQMSSGGKATGDVNSMLGSGMGQGGSTKTKNLRKGAKRRKKRR